MLPSHIRIGISYRRDGKAIDAGADVPRHDFESLFKKACAGAGVRFEFDTGGLRMGALAKPNVLPFAVEIAFMAAGDKTLEVLETTSRNLHTTTQRALLTGGILFHVEEGTITIQTPDIYGIGPKDRIGPPPGSPHP